MTTEQYQQADAHLREILTILMEECAEVIQECSKVQRFGIDSIHKSGCTNWAALEKEVGDLLAMIEILVMEDRFNEAGFKRAKQDKYIKLRQYSQVFRDINDPNV